MLAPALLLAAAAATSAPAFDPDEVYVEGLSYSGAACEAGSFSFSSAPDLSYITLLYGDYKADGAAKTGCKLELNLHVPHGWRFAPRAIEILGSTQLGPKAEATQEVTLLRPKRQTLGVHTMKGPIAGDFRYTAPIKDAPFSPCEGTVKLPVDLDARVNGPGVVRGLSVDGELRVRLRLDWERCGAAPVKRSE